MLWEMYWNLVGEFGYDPDLYNGTGGNNLAYQLSLDGMKLQPCQPGFVTGRDGILAADQANYDGDLACHIWTAFAERGVGSAASQGSSNVVGDETELGDSRVQPAVLRAADRAAGGSVWSISSTGGEKRPAGSWPSGPRAVVSVTSHSGSRRRWLPAR